MEFWIRAFSDLALAWSGGLRQLKLSSIGLAFFVLLIGIMLVMMGFLGGQETEKKRAQAPGYSVYTREIVKVRCSHCGSLNIETETSTRCKNCGASL